MVANKFNRRHLAVGHWASPWRFTQAHQIAEKIRVTLQDKLITRGRWVELYQPVMPGHPGAVACTCTKDTTETADYACLTCHGAKFAPGYLKFLHDTHFWCSAEHASFALNNVEVATTKKGHMLQLAPGQLTGTITSSEKTYSNAPGLPYEVKLEAYRRATGSTFALHASTNGGTTWTAVALTEVPSPGHGFVGVIPPEVLPATGSVRFRVTMSRVAVTDLAPVFEIVRIRRPLIEHENPEILRVRPDHSPGHVLILRPWVQEQDSLESGRGRIVEHLSDQTWTAPLDFFHRGLTPDTPACRIDSDVGPHPFYAFSSGVQAATRYALTQIRYNDQLGIFTHQYFTDRRTQRGEAYHLVW